MPGCQEPGPLEDLRDTVKAYGRHVLACTGDEPWPARVEQKDDLVGRMGQDVKRLGVDVDPAPKFTALRTPPQGDGTDLLVFPDAVAYRGVDADAWEAIRDQHLREGEPVEALNPEPLSGHHILVCVHMERDERCGHCGPLVAEAFKKAVADRGDASVTIHKSSHVGGHRFAGNVLVYPGGTWYGYVRPPDVNAILEAHLDGDTVWEPHVRGAMATSGEK